MIKIDVFSMIFGGIVIPAVWQMVRIAWQLWKDGEDHEQHE